ncbi:MAG: TIGR02206 family membrane protein [Saprospiraceae bacterium]
MDQGFHTFSSAHIIVLLVLVVITLVIITIGQRTEGRMKIWIGYSVASTAFALQLIDLGMRLMNRTLDVLVDLPLFLCDIVAIVLPSVILLENRKWIGIFYFWALAGTLQALITPELRSTYPAFEFFRYFIMHGFIVSAVLYYVIVMRIRITWKDLLNAIIYAQVYLVAIHIVNMMLRSNYSYTMAKPASATVLNYFGDWPWYIFFAEGLMIILFIILLIPFLIIYPNNTGMRDTNPELD